MDVQSPNEPKSPEPRGRRAIAALQLGMLGRRTRDTLMTYVGVITVLAALIIFFSTTTS